MRGYLILFFAIGFYFVPTRPHLGPTSAPPRLHLGLASQNLGPASQNLGPSWKSWAGIRSGGHLDDFLLRQQMDSGHMSNKFEQFPTRQWNIFQNSITTCFNHASDNQGGLGLPPCQANPARQAWLAKFIEKSTTNTLRMFKFPVTNRLHANTNHQIQCSESIYLYKRN